MISLRGDRRIETVSFVTEQPGRRLAQQLVGLVEIDLAVSCSRENLNAGCANLLDHRHCVSIADDWQVKQAARRRTNDLAVVRIDAVTGEDCRIGTHCVGDANDGARVTWFVDLDRHCEQAGVLMDGCAQRYVQ